MPRDTCSSRPYSTPLVLLALSVLSACHRENESVEQHEDAPVVEKKNFPDADFTVEKGVKDALFTWVDQDGSFQITDDPSSIPESARKTVRVVKEGHSPGGPDHVYVVDLTKLDEATELDVRPITRTEWEVLGKKQRDERVSALAPPAPEGSSPAALGVDAIVYGAEWCKPCHLAEDYLRKKGVRVVKKDIEEDPAAASEMRQKLQGAGMSGSSIPVLDIGGTILRGFSEGSVDAALKKSGIGKKP